MNDQPWSNNTAPSPYPNSSASGVEGTSADARASYQRQRPHITQEPIDDIPTEYVMPERYTTVDRARAQQGARRHMGVASSDPEYMVYTSSGETDDSQPPRKVKQPKTHASSFNYDRYLQTPTSGKSIFTSRQDRRRKRIQRLFVVCVAGLVALVIVYLIAF